MAIAAARIHAAGDRVEAVATMGQTPPVEIFFRASNAALSPSPDALVPLMLLPAMASRSTTRIEGAVSPRLAAAIPAIQALFVGWFPDRFHPVEVDVDLAEPSGKPSDLTACLFTAGLDSFTEVLRRRDEIDELIYLHGYDVRPGPEGPRSPAREAVRAAAAELGLPLIEVDSDIRLFLDPRVTWADSHGAALAAAVLLLQDRYGRVLVPSSHERDDLSAWGSHPLLDPLWSTERLEIEHSGRGLTRIEKATLVSESEIALRHLQVCWRRSPTEVNCGRCEKCLRTAVALLAVGALERSQTLPHRLDARLENLELDENSRGYWEKNLAALKAAGRAPEIAALIERALGRIATAPDRDGAPQIDAWGELEWRAALDLERVPTGRGSLREAARRLLLRALRPHTAHQKTLDQHMVSALFDLRQQLEAERDVARLLRRRVERLEAEQRGDASPPNGS